MLTENKALRDLLLIHEQHGVLEKDVEEHLTQHETTVKPVTQEEDEMPEELKNLLQARVLVKAH